jgi:hypothetical protein
MYLYFSVDKAVRRRLVAGPLSSRSRCEPRPIYVEYITEKLILRHVFLRVLARCQYHFTIALYTIIHYRRWAYIIVLAIVSVVKQTKTFVDEI